MTRPIQASLDLQVMKQNLAIVRRSGPRGARLVGSESQRLRPRY